MLIPRILTSTPDILLSYDTLRRRENEALLRLLDTLPLIDGLPPGTIEQARDAVFHTDHPFLLVLIGPFGSGKSTLINAFLGEPVLPTGPVPTTDHIIILRYGEHVERIAAPDGTETVFYPAPLLRSISLVDTPGLESVFAQHAERTDAFLHRSDWVVLVMLATQALTASNLQYLESLRDYGKRVLVVVNQVDLLDPSQQDTLRAFVQEQCLIHLGTEPQVFLTAARQGLAARQAEPPDEVAWQASGMAELESFLVRSLDDRGRLRQKLQTPIQIARNVLATARHVVEEQQRALDRHRSVQENIDAQIAASRGQQQRLLESTLEAIAARFGEVSMRGEEAIQELFQPARALSQVVAGMAELLGLAGLARRLGARSRAALAFEAHEVLAPLDELPALVADLGPRLEGRDLQDLDDLAVYTQDALKTLPGTLQDKVIGEVRPPVTYNREPLRRVRGDLEAVVAEARQVEPARLDRAVRNALVLLAGWELAIVVAVALLGSLAVDWTDVGTPLLLVLGALTLMLVGLALMPLRGRMLARAYAERTLALSQRYQAVVREAAEEQIAYGVRLRQDMVAPFTRLVSAQVALLGERSRELRKLEDDLAALASEIGGF